MTSAMILFIPLTVLWGRVSLAAGAVEQAAESAARTASIARTPALAQSTAQTTAADSLDQQGLECDTSVQVDISGFTVQVGTPATVSATVTCQVRLSDLHSRPSRHPPGRGTRRQRPRHLPGALVITAVRGEDRGARRWSA